MEIRHLKLVNFDPGAFTTDELVCKFKGVVSSTVQVDERNRAGNLASSLAFLPKKTDTASEEG